MNFHFIQWKTHMLFSGIFKKDMNIGIEVRYGTDRNQ